MSDLPIVIKVTFLNAGLRVLGIYAINDPKF